MEDPCCMLISPNFLEAILVQEKKKNKKAADILPESISFEMDSSME